MDHTWFEEVEQGSLKFGMSVKEELFHAKSDFQDVRVFDTHAYGRVLTLDGCVMISDADEFVYHEMIAHIPVCLHSAPRKVIVIGGGDGGTVRELLKHREVEEIVLCEIDAMVVEACRKFFPAVAGSLDDPRVQVKIGDGIAYMQELENAADIVVVDSAEISAGLGDGLFTEAFYRSVARALRPGGLVVAQSESPWMAPDLVRRIHQNMRGGFAFVRPYVGAIPTYPRGLWSWTIAAQAEIVPARFNAERFAKVSESLKYLTKDLALAAFALPKFYASALK